MEDGEVNHGLGLPNDGRRQSRCDVADAKGFADAEGVVGAKGVNDAKGVVEAEGVVDAEGDFDAGGVDDVEGDVDVEGFVNDDEETETSEADSLLSVTLQPPFEIQC